MNPFISHDLRGTREWVYVGLSSSYPDLIDTNDEALSDLQFCGPDLRPGCSIFHVPRMVPSSFVVDPFVKAEATKIDLFKLNEDNQSSELQYEVAERQGDLKDQVLVFKYKGRVHAVDHQCPHSSYSLSNATLFDIEDFGIVLSSGITCPKHGWSFDLFSGHADRGGYRLNIWEVQLREPANLRQEIEEGTDFEEQIMEVWIRRKQRIG